MAKSKDPLGKIETNLKVKVVRAKERSYTS